MTKEKQCISGDDAVVEDHFDLIPVDLFLNTILSRLPLKSLAKCRCVSKQWSSIIRRPNYDLLFPIKSPTTLRLLFALGKEKRLFFSSPQPRNPDNKNGSPSLLATRHASFATEYCCKVRTCPPVNGLVCSHHTESKYSRVVISNPITGEYVTTPKVTSHWGLKIYFGYDPIGNQFKVLLITWFLGSHVNQVLTLGAGNLSWRKIQCCKFNHPCYEGGGICINGLLYYQVIIRGKKWIACFDVRSEKFSFIKLDHMIKATNISEPLILIDYKGKLGAIHHVDHSDLLVLWVLDNAEEHKWFIMHQIQRPSLLKPPFSAAMIGGGEIVFYQTIARHPSYIWYHNLERNIITRRVSIQVTVDSVDFENVHIFPNFVEDVKLM